jgi:hypothetical protein
MIVIALFIGFVIVGGAMNFAISSVVEQASKFASLLVFLGLFIVVFPLSWIAAVRITERYILRRD